MRLEVLLILALILVGGLIYYKDGGFDSVAALLTVSDTATSTDETATTTSRGYLAAVGNWFSGLVGNDPEQDEADEEDPGTTAAPRRGASAPTAPPPTLETPEVEAKVTKKQQELEELPEGERENELFAPRSPYAGQVELSAGRAREKEAEDEYVMLRANATAEISGWRLESYVTDSSATIPEGAALLETYGDRTKDPITLMAGATAYLTTGETPLKTSFKENLCTGYLDEYGDFSPSLKRQCPLPGDELLRFGNIADDDDECYDYIERLRQCDVVTRSELESADLSSRCESFIKSTFDYDECVDRHQDDAGFDEVGVWRIYLDQAGELWLSTREIIRLLDEDGRVVDVVEY